MKTGQALTLVVRSVGFGHGPRLNYSDNIAHTASRTQYIVGSRSMDATDLPGCCAPFVGGLHLILHVSPDRPELEFPRLIRVPLGLAAVELLRSGGRHRLARTGLSFLAVQSYFRSVRSHTNGTSFNTPASVTSAPCL